jgi:hypothetical protein
MLLIKLSSITAANWAAVGTLGQMFFVPSTDAIMLSCGLLLLLPDRQLQ